MTIMCVLLMSCLLMAVRCSRHSEDVNDLRDRLSCTESVVSKLVESVTACNMQDMGTEIGILKQKYTDLMDTYDELSRNNSVMTASLSGKNNIIVILASFIRTYGRLIVATGSWHNHYYCRHQHCDQHHNQRHGYFETYNHYQGQQVQ